MRSLCPAVSKTRRGPISAPEPHRRLHRHHPIPNKGGELARRSSPRVVSLMSLSPNTGLPSVSRHLRRPRPRPLKSSRPVPWTRSRWLPRLHLHSAKSLQRMGCSRLDPSDCPAAGQPLLQIQSSLRACKVPPLLQAQRALAHKVQSQVHLVRIGYFEGTNSNPSSQTTQRVDTAGCSSEHEGHETVPSVRLFAVQATPLPQDR